MTTTISRPPWQLEGTAVVDANNYYVAMTSAHGKSTKRQDADARLIAAAPQLLEALRPFAALLQDHHQRNCDEQPIFGINDVTITVGDMRRAAAAIAAATGESK
jgi:hypothetical protein